MGMSTVLIGTIFMECSCRLSTDGWMVHLEAGLTKLWLHSGFMWVVVLYADHKYTVFSLIEARSLI